MQAARRAAASRGAGELEVAEAAKIAEDLARARGTAAKAAASGGSGSTNHGDGSAVEQGEDQLPKIRQLSGDQLVCLARAMHGSTAKRSDIDAAVKELCEHGMEASF